MGQSYYTEEHEIFRDTFRKYLEKEVVPQLDEWEKNKDIPKIEWKKMGQHGFLCPWLEEELGGAGAGFEYSIIINEELARVRANGFSLGLHSDIVAPYIDRYGSDEQRRRWLPGAASGDIVLAVAMTRARRRFRPSGHPDPRGSGRGFIRD